MAEKQNYQNHTRWYPLVHFVIFPLLVINLLCHLVRLVWAPTIDRGFWTLLSVVLALMVLAGRQQALKAQDRTIRLEERLRYKELLTPELAKRASELPTGKIIAMRFASDEELADLVNKVLDGKLNTSKEIKMAVNNWRGDYLRV